MRRHRSNDRPAVIWNDGWLEYWDNGKEYARKYPDERFVRFIEDESERGLEWPSE